jgi:hypothetical protein
MRTRLFTSLVVIWAVGACAGSEAARADLPIVVDASRLLPFTTDLGETVTLTSARVVAEDLVLFAGGTAHAALTKRRHPSSILPSWLVGTAKAHPGHGEGGDALGALSGRFVIDLFDDGTAIGTAQALYATYDAFGFTFAQGQADDGLADDDALLDATLALTGTVSTGGETVAFTVAVPIDAGEAMTGGRFSLTVDEHTEATLGLSLRPREDSTGESLLDGIAFSTLTRDETTVPQSVTLTDEMVRRIARAAQLHLYWDLVVR